MTTPSTALVQRPDGTNIELGTRGAAMTRTSEQLEAEATGRVCLRCESEPRVVWLGGLTGESRHGLRCNCELPLGLEPLLGEDVHPVKRRYQKMVAQAMEMRPRTIPLDIEEIREYINPLATPQEAYLFLRFCQQQGLSPFLNEAYLVKYKPDAKASIIIGINALVKRADASGLMEYLASGTITVQNGELHEQSGAIVPPGHELFGAWAEVKRRDRTRPYRVAVMLTEYVQTTADGRPNKFWREKPATMIQVRAQAQALNRAFSSETAGLMQGAEGVTVEVGEPEAAAIPIEESGLFPPADAPADEETDYAQYPAAYRPKDTPTAANATQRPQAAHRPTKLPTVVVGDTDDDPDGGFDDGTDGQTLSDPIAEAQRDAEDPAGLSNHDVWLEDAKRRWNKTEAQIAAALGVPAPDGRLRTLKDYPKAWAELVKMWGQGRPA